MEEQWKQWQSVFLDSKIPVDGDCSHEIKKKKKIFSLEESESCPIMSDSLRPRGLYSPWNSLGQNTGVGSLSLLQRIKPSQASHIAGDSLSAEPWEKPLEEKAMTNLDSVLKSRDITLATKLHMVKSMVFSSSHLWMWELDHKEGWAPNNWCFWTMVLEKMFESLLDCKEIELVILKEINPEYPL